MAYSPYQLPGINPNPTYGLDPSYPGLLGYDPETARKKALFQGLLGLGAGIASADRRNVIGGGLLGFDRGIQQAQDMQSQALNDQFKMADYAQKQQDRQKELQIQQQQAQALQQALGGGGMPSGPAPQGPPPAMTPPIGMGQRPQMANPQIPTAQPTPQNGGIQIPDNIRQAALLAAQGGGAGAGLKVIQDFIAQPQAYKERRIATGGGTQYQEQYSMDGGRNWQNVGDAYDIRAASGGANISIDNKVSAAGDQQQAKTLGEYYGKKLGDILDSGFTAPATIAKYQQLGTYLSQVDTGKLAPTTQNLKQYAKAVGIDLESLGVKDDTAPAQAAQALTNEIALTLRNPQGGAGMPGALSDRDREFLQSMPPGIEKVPGANKLLLDYRIRMARRDQEVAKLARDYASKNNGLLDGGFFDQLDQWSSAHPLFSEQDQQQLNAAGAPAASGGAVNYIWKDGQLVPQ